MGDVRVEVHSVGKGNIRIFRPTRELTGAGLLWMHGGGFIIGSAAQDGRFCSWMAGEMDLVVVSVDYRLAPEDPYPAAIDDCFTAWEWVQENAPNLGIDPGRIALAGQSAGGGLAACLAHRIHDSCGRQPAAQLLIYVPLLTLVVGFIVSSIGMYYVNRWGRSPRPDELLDRSLKGFGREYKLYHYALPAPHVLLAPNGPIVLIAKFEGGEFTVEGDRWRQRFSPMRVLGFMGREGLGNPTKDADYLVEKMRRFLEENNPELQEVPVSAVVVFTAEKVVLNVGETRVPTLRAAKLKGYLRSQASRPLPQETRQRLEALFDAAAGITN